MNDANVSVEILHVVLERLSRQIEHFSAGAQKRDATMKNGLSNGRTKFQFQLINIGA